MVHPINNRGVSVQRPPARSEKQYKVPLAGSSSTGAPLGPRISSVYPSASAQSQASSDATFHQVEVTEVLRTQLHTACTRYFQQGVPVDLLEMFEEPELEIWSAPKQDGQSVEMMLVVPEGYGRVRTWSLEIGEEGADMLVHGAYYRIMRIIPDRLLPAALSANSMESQESVKISTTKLSGQFIEICRNIVKHPSLARTFDALTTQSLASVMTLSCDTNGIPRYGFGLFPADAASNSSTFKTFFSGAIVLAQHLPSMGTLVDGIIPGAFLLQAQSKGGEPVTETLTMRDAAALGIAPEVFFSGEAAFNGEFYDLFVLARAATETGTLLHQLSLEDRWRVAKDLCSKLWALHSINISHGDLKPQNMVSEYFEDVSVDAAVSMETTHPLGTWLIDFGFSITGAAWKESLDKLSEIVPTLHDMRKIEVTYNLHRRFDVRLLKKINTQLGNPVNVALLKVPASIDDYRFAYRQLSKHIRHVTSSLVHTLLRHAGGTPVFCDPDLMFLRPMAKQAYKKLSQPLAGNYSAVAKSIETILWYYKGIDLFKADVWSLGICLLYIAYGSESNQVGQCIKDLVKASERDPNVSDWQAFKETRKTMAQGLHKFIATGLDTMSFSNELDEKRFSTLCSLAQACLSADPRQRPSVEEVLDSLQAS